ncbi:MAG: chemotaxis protein CheA, partial [Desulfatitalea sp.]|nr:chemotaxis protein CheA [Desulfatitalea sp.]
GKGVDWAVFAQQVTGHYIGRVKTLFAKVPALASLDASAPAAAQLTEADAPAEGALQAEAQGQQTTGLSPGDQGLLKDFIDEATEHLEEVERNLLDLVHQPDPAGILNELFRSIHTIKGASEYLGLARIAELSHKLESLLDLLRRGQRTVNTGVTDLLMAAHDRIGLLVNNLVEHGQEQSPIEDLLVGIDAWLESATTDDSQNQTTPAAAEPITAAAGGEADPGTTIYQEPYDSQLFTIYMRQLNEGLAALAAQVARVTPDGSAAESVRYCRQWLSRLQSAANYMEYDALKSVYGAWIEDLHRSELRLSDSDPAVWQSDYSQMMKARADQVRGFFQEPDAGAAAPMEPPEPLQEGVTAVVEDRPEPLPVVPVPDMSETPGPRAGMVAQTIAESEALETGAMDEQTLMARLESAFDANVDFSGAVDGATMAHLDVANELLSEMEDVLDHRLTAAMGARDHARAAQGYRPAAESNDLEALLFSDDTGSRIPRKPLAPMPLAGMSDPAEVASLLSLETDTRSGGYAPGRRRSDKLHDRLSKQSIRVDAAKIDTLMNQVGELVVSRAGFNQLFMEMREVQLALKQTQKLSTAEMKSIAALTNRVNEATVALGRVTSELQENVMKVRMLPIAQLFSRYPRLVHDLVRNTDKKVALEIHGEETELDRMVIEQIADPMVHIIRNAVDHGIEPAAERQRKGKPENGTLRLEAYYEGNYVVVEVSDDGRGIDAFQIKARAQSKGFATAEALAAMSDDQVLALIMKPGFSTVDEVTHTSGRGVGMDVVKDNIEKLNGTIEIISTPGHSTLFRIRIPLTLAIIQALLVDVAGTIFTIPLSAVDETLRIHQNEISTLEGMEIYYLRETTLPLIRLSRVLKMDAPSIATRELFVVVVNAGSRQVGFVVDQLRGRQEVVIKPLEDYLQERSGFSGATILGDGSISLILDVSELINLAVAQHSRRMKAVAL